jgi:Leucine-rich repeat (LRR) protein
MRFSLCLLSTVLAPALAAAQPKNEDAVTKEWVAKVQALPPGQQAGAVADKLRKLNAPVVGVQEKVTDAGVTELIVSNMSYVEDITPLAALTALEKLDINSGKVKDITPLQGMKKLKSLNIAGNPVASLAPLRGLPLEELSCSSCSVPAKLAPQWLGPVATLTKLRVLNCANAGVYAGHLSGLRLENFVMNTCRLPKEGGLAVVRNMPLKSLSCVGCGVFDLKPLAGKRDLKTLNLTGNPVFDLSPLKTATGLETLILTETPVLDLSPLKGHKALRYLSCSHSKVPDLSPLKGLRLTYLALERCPVSDLIPLDGMPLEDLNLDDTKGVVSLAPLKNCPLRGLNLSGNPNLEDLAPLANVKTLSRVYLGGTKVRDLTPLKNLPLTGLGVGALTVDLAPLQALEINNLDIRGAKITDLAPLKGWPLQQINCDVPIKGELRDILKEKPTLTHINNGPKEESLK